MIERGNQRTVIVVSLWTPRPSIIIHKGPLYLEYHRTPFVVREEKCLSAGVLSDCPSLLYKFSLKRDRLLSVPDIRSMSKMDTGYPA